jgi:hypothetical protein
MDSKRVALRFELAIAKFADGKADHHDRAIMSILLKSYMYSLTSKRREDLLEQAAWATTKGVTHPY